MAAYTLNRDRLLSELNTALRRAGVILPDGAKDVMIAFTLDRLLAQRERLAGIVDSLAGMYEDGLTSQQVDTLSRLIREHSVDANGNICLQDD